MCLSLRAAPSLPWDVAEGSVSESMCMRERNTGPWPQGGTPRRAPAERRPEGPPPPPPPDGNLILGFPGVSDHKESACQYRKCRRRGFDPWVRKISWRRKWQLILVFLSGKAQEQRNLVGYSPWGLKESDTIEQLRESVLSQNTHTHTHTHTISLFYTSLIGPFIPCTHWIPLCLMTHSQVLKFKTWTFRVPSFCLPPSPSPPLSHPLPYQHTLSCCLLHCISNYLTCCKCTCFFSVSPTRMHHKAS